MDGNTDSTQSYYTTYDEENRIKQDQAHRVEFIITMDVLNQLLSDLNPNNTVVADIGCGTGNYTVEIAPFVSRLYACDIMPHLLQQMSQKLEPSLLNKVIPISCSAERMASIPTNSCDITLCMGPLYHLCEETSRSNCLSELKRITKPHGKIVITYLNPRALWANISREKMTLQEFERIEMQDCLLVSPFYFTSPKQIEKELLLHHFSIMKHVALDAFTSFMIDEVNGWDGATYNSWLTIVRRHMEDLTWLEFSSHSLIVAEGAE